MDKKNERTNEDAPTQQSPEILHDLLSVCRTARQKNMVQAVWGNRGILTHTLHEYVFANNLHAVSASVNRWIEPLGWRIIKVENASRSASSSWYLVSFNSIASGETQ